MNRYLRTFGVLVAVLLLATSLAAQTSTTGALEGRVTDESGPLPGVTIEVSSPALQGARVEVTNADGRFRFTNIPPGLYRVSASLGGFATVTQANVRVALGSTAALEVRMSPSTVSQEITVTAEAPVVDVTSAKTGANVTAETMETLPLARDFYSVAKVAPGTNEDASGTTFYGSTGAENQYIIDGLNTTGVEVGTEAKRLNFDFIQEVEVLTGGLPAEYGRLTGGVINAITKSGGNEFSGDVFGYTAGGGLQSDNTTGPERPRWATTVAEVESESDYGFDLGGYLMRDRVWFFAAYNRVDETLHDRRIQPLVIPGVGTLPAGTEFATDVARDIYAGKLTFRLSDAHNITASIIGDPTEREGALFTIAGPETTYQGIRETGGMDWVTRYSGIFGGRFVVNALAGFHEEEDFLSGPGAALPLTIDTTVSPNTRTGGWGFFQDQTFERQTYKVDLGGFVGTHDLKIGVDMEELSAVNANYYTGGGDLVYRLRNRGPDNVAGTADDIIYYRHRFYVTPETYVRTDPSTWEIQYPLFSEPATDNIAFYAQDSWRIVPSFTFNFGVRMEQQEIGGRDGTTQITIDDNIAPRVGFVWDVLNNGRSKFYGNYGRFHESIPMDINIRQFGGEIVVFSYNFDPTPGSFMPDATAPTRTGGLGGSTTPTDPDLKGQYIDEMILGYEQEVAANLSLGIKATYRDLGRIIEDFLIPGTGNYAIANPGSGVGTRVGFYDYWTTYDETLSTAPAPEGRREYTGVELSARKRFSNSTQFFASYLWSQLEGNYDGLFQTSTGQLDPNINSAFDYADFMLNADGKLSADRTHQFKFNGSYSVPSGALTGLDIGLSAYYASGTPITAMGYSYLYQNWEYYLTPRGSVGRNPADYEADLHFGYPIRMGGVETNLLLDIFNLFDRQSATRLDDRYNLVQDGSCAGIPEDQCNGDNGWDNIVGTTEPVGRLTDPRATATNPDFAKAGVSFTQPRSIRFGVRVSF